jgi:hypothetical protein
MSQKTKTFIAIFASITAILIVAFVAVLVVVGIGTFRAVTAAKDPADNARTAAKIADFRLPPGYRVLTAMDLSVVKMAVVAPSDRARRGFVMELEGMSLPIGSQSDDEIMHSMQQGLSYGVTCTNLKRSGEDRVTTASGRPIVLSVLECTTKGSERTLEFGRIPAKVPFGAFLAAGTPGEFDRTAVHELLQSLH